MHSIALHHGVTPRTLAIIFATTHHVKPPSAHSFCCACVHSLATFQGSGGRTSKCTHIHFAACACVHSFSHIHQVSNTAMSNVSWSTMSNSTQSPNTTLASMSVGGLPPVPNPIGGPLTNEAIGPIAALNNVRQLSCNALIRQLLLQGMRRPMLRISTTLMPLLLPNTARCF
jgi:hypothetical protein